jgi:hypothetical protein
VKTIRKIGMSFQMFFCFFFVGLDEPVMASDTSDIGDGSIVDESDKSCDVIS